MVTHVPNISIFIYITAHMGLLHRRYIKQLIWIIYDWAHKSNTWKEKAVCGLLPNHSREKYIRQCHVGAWIEGHLDDGRAVDVHLLAGRGVAAGHPAGLVESMRLHTPCIVSHKYLQNHRLVHTLQLCEWKTEKELKNISRRSEFCRSE